jgi:endonuclease YncB( thermonuclease family)
MNRIVAMVVSLVLATTACTASVESPESPNVEPTVASPAGTAVVLSRVVDGDSIEVEADGRTVDVRLIGINAPEGGECFGDRSRTALMASLDASSLVLVEGADADTDQYGRLLRYVYVDGENVNGRMLADGNAVTLQGDHRYNESFVEIGDLAAAGGYGMWAPDACGTPPPAGATIVGVEHDPPGPDDERLNDESVTIGNEGTTTIALVDWTLRDESSQNRYVFDDLALAPGDRVAVRTGCGSDIAGTVHWCANRSVWSNGGDTVILQDSNGNVVDRWMYRAEG